MPLLWGGRRRRRLLLFGQGAVAESCARALSGGSEQLIRAQGAHTPARELSKANVWVLAGLDEPLSFLDALMNRREQMHLRRPLRVLIIGAGPAPIANVLASARRNCQDDVQLEQVSIPAAAARRLLASWPLHWGADPLFGQGIHLLILGRNPFAEALLLQALRVSGYGERRTRFTLLSEAARAWEQAFTRSYPQAHEIADVRFGSLETVDLAAAPPVTTAVVCIKPIANLEPELELEPGLRPVRTDQSAPIPIAESLRQARALAKRLLDLQQVSPPIFVEIGDVAPDGELGDWDGQLIPISDSRLALDRAALLEGRGDELARVIHDHYRDTTEAQGRDPSLEPAGQPWPTLASSYRDANRHQADHLWAKLAMTDCQAVPESQVESFAFAPIEVERLAVIEHRRWAADRWLDGWSYAPTRDNARKHHPQLIPYQQLSGPMKDLDRFAVRLVPTLLARSGLGVLRMLLVGLAPVKAPHRNLAKTQLDTLMRRALARLAARYPDRALIIASSLEEVATRRFAWIATNELGTGFFLLLPQPLPQLLGNLDASERLQVLALVALAERRIPLSGAVDLGRWLDQRAEILVELGAPDEVSASADSRRKRVCITPDAGLQWSFEY